MTEAEAQDAAIRQLVTHGYLTPDDGLSGRVEIYRYDLDTGGTILWNVTLAQAFIAAGRSLGLEEVPRAQMALVAARDAYDPVHVGEVDPTTPGICAPLIEAGAVQYIVIDGRHRLVRAYQMGQPFQVEVLRDRDARICVLAAPQGRLP
jgi:hypothetical protein